MRNYKMTASSRENKKLQEKICNHSSATWLCHGQYLPNYNNENRGGSYIWSYNLGGDLNPNTCASELFYQQ